MVHCLVFVFGVAAGAILMWLLGPRTVGTLLHYYDEDGEGPYLFLSLWDDVGSVIKRKYVTFKVKDQASRENSNSSYGEDLN